MAKKDLGIGDVLEQINQTEDLYVSSLKKSEKTKKDYFKKNHKIKRDPTSKVNPNENKIDIYPNKVNENKIEVLDKPPLNYNLLKDIKKCSLYHLKSDRNEQARLILEQNCSLVNKNIINAGQLIMFNYFEPKTKEELEYYDAKPVTIFFGLFNSKEGKRYLGFNIHYYPPQLRYQIMNKIFEIYRPIYMKYWENVDKVVDAFDYQYLISQLQKAKLDFGVRMYIPALCGKPITIPPKFWKYSVFTEGEFKKQTKVQIMKYWRDKTNKILKR